MTKATPRRTRQSKFQPTAKCAEEGCERLNEYRCGGYCQPHYRKHLAERSKPCAVEGCELPVKTKGYCQAHYVRWCKYGDPGPVEIKMVKRFGCLVEGCERPHASDGYCHPHYLRWKKVGDPGSVEIEPRRRAVWSEDGTEGTCVECGETKAAEEFYERNGRRIETCKECVKAQRKQRYDENPELLRERQVGYMLKFNFGMTRDGYDALLSAQGGGCAICGTEPDGQRLAVDHCHDTGIVRGILCFGCNSGLGLFGDDAALIERAAAYLEATG
jgi:hypothetical protein